MKLNSKHFDVLVNKLLNTFSVTFIPNIPVKNFNYKLIDRT